MLQEIDLFGITVKMYNVFNILSMIILFLYFISKTKRFIAICPHALKQNTAGKQTLVAVVETLVLFFLGMFLLYFLNTGFGKWFTNGNANYYGSLTAWLLAFIIVPLVYGISPLAASDIFALGLPLSLFVAKLACFFHGCCSSIELSGGFYYNQNTNRYEFPVQLVEAFVALAIYFFLRVYRKKIPQGDVFPAYIFLFSVTRFFTEFLRDDTPDVLGPFNAYQILSVIFAAISCFLFVSIKAEQDRRAERQQNAAKKRRKDKVKPKEVHKKDSSLSKTPFCR